MPILIYLLLMNLLGFFTMGMDKRRARLGLYRISEKALFLFAFLGGSVGSFAGMHLFHHKTRHWYFRYGLPALILLQAALWFFFLRHLIPISL